MLNVFSTEMEETIENVNFLEVIDEDTSSIQKLILNASEVGTNIVNDMDTHAQKTHAQDDLSNDTRLQDVNASTSEPIITFSVLNDILPLEMNVHSPTSPSNNSRTVITITSPSNIIGLALTHDITQQ